jgi:hypothetical protein
MQREHAPVFGQKHGIPWIVFAVVVLMPSVQGVRCCTRMTLHEAGTSVDGSRLARSSLQQNCPVALFIPHSSERQSEVNSEHPHTCCAVMFK